MRSEIVQCSHFAPDKMQIFRWRTSDMLVFIFLKCMKKLIRERGTNLFGSSSHLLPRTCVSNETAKLLHLKVEGFYVFPGIPYIRWKDSTGILHHNIFELNTLKLINLNIHWLANKSHLNSSYYFKLITLLVIFVSDGEDWDLTRTSSIGISWIQGYWS